MASYSDILPGECNYVVTEEIKKRNPETATDGVYVVRDKKTMQSKILKYFYSDRYGPDNPNEIGISSTFRHPNIISLELLINKDCNIKGLGEIVDFAQSTYIQFLGNVASTENRLIKTGQTDRYNIMLYILNMKLVSALKILYAIQFMHRQGYLHLDIKYDNVVVLNDNPCVTDFGNSIRCKDVKKGIYLTLDHYVGTIYYIPPEVYKKELNTPIHYNHAVDIWALGHLMFAIFFSTTIHPPELYAQFKEPDNKFKVFEINDLLTNPNYVNNYIDVHGHDKYPPALLDLFKSFFNNIWQADPEKRPTVSDIIRSNLFDTVRAQNSPPEGQVYQMTVLLKEHQSKEITQYLKLLLGMAKKFNLTFLPIVVLTTAIDIYYRTYHSTLSAGSDVNKLRQNLAYACFYISLRAHTLTDYNIYNRILAEIREGEEYFSQMLFKIYIILKGDINRNSYYQLCEGANHVKYLLFEYIFKPEKYIPCEFAKFKQELKTIPPDSKPDMSIEEFSTYITNK